jgi:hypothetical protein
MKLIIFSLLLFAAGMTAVAADSAWSVVSPDKNVKMTVEHDSSGGLSYTVLLNGKTAVGKSQLGIARKDQSFVSGLEYVGEKTKKVVIDYTMPHGKRRHCSNKGNEITLSFKNSKGALLDVIAQAFNDGVAFRYRFPETSKEIFEVTQEHTRFQIAMGGKGYLLPHDKAGQYWPAYENVFREVDVGVASPKWDGWDFPALFHIVKDSVWVLITESDLDKSYTGCRLARKSENGLYSLRLPDRLEGNGKGHTKPQSSLPWQTPWRVIMLGDSPGDILESTLAQDLGAPSIVKDVSWIKPGRSSWSWWSASDSSKDADAMKKFVDLAVEMKWEYFLIDANWNTIPKEKFEELIQYAKDKKIGLLLWYNSGGDHNYVDELPRGRMTLREARRKEMKWLKEKGVKGIKVDFWHSDKQNVIKLYHEVFEDAAEFEILVNCHGCTIPRGWQRTYPHLMTMESVRGAEAYKWSRANPEDAVWHNTILPFTRNTIGPMDYTPVTFSDQKHRHKTTWAHELALSVVFESGIQHFADKVDAYVKLPAGPKEFLQDVPVAWDDTKYLSGVPSKYVVVARRKGKDWYIGGINGQKEAQKVTVGGEFLGKKKYKCTLIQDGNNPKEFKTTETQISRKKPLEVEMPQFGGFVMKLVRY